MKLHSIEIEKPVGYYQITGKNTSDYGNMKFMFYKKPNFIHRLFCKLLLGWVWGEDV